MKHGLNMLDNDGNRICRETHKARLSPLLVSFSFSLSFYLSIDIQVQFSALAQDVYMIMNSGMMCKSTASLIQCLSSNMWPFLPFYLPLFLSPLCIFSWLWYCLPPSKDPVSMVMGCPCHCLASALQRLAVGLAYSQACIFADANVLCTEKSPHTTVCSFVVNLTSDSWQDRQKLLFCH